MHPLTQKTSLGFDEEVTQAFQNANDLILHTLRGEAPLGLGQDRLELCCEDTRLHSWSVYYARAG